MVLNNKLIVLLVFNLLLGGALLGNNADTLGMLPKRAISELKPMFAPTLSGKHPTEYAFAIEAPTKKQIEAWLEGDFEYLSEVFDSSLISKGQLFGDAQTAIGKARKAIQEVLKIGNLIKSLDGSNLVNLPVGISKSKDDGTQFVVAVNRITLYPTYANLSVFAEVKTPDMEQPLYFGAPDIKFSRNGGILGGSLGLLGDLRIPILSGNADLFFKGAVVLDNEFDTNAGNYVEFDCNGLQGFNLDVDLELSREVAIPVDQNGFPKPSGLVRANLGLNAANGLNDFVINLDLSDQPFVHNSKKDIIWTIKNLVFDFSEVRHGPFQFPVAEYNPLLPDVNLWKGVYIEEFSVKLPDQFNEQDQVEKSSLGASVKDMVIDQNGLTGLVAFSNLIPLQDGNMDGWPFSIDLFKIHLYRNNLAALTFDGVIDVPLFSSETEGENTGFPEIGDSTGIDQALSYHADFDIKDDQYLFRVNTEEDLIRYSKMLKAQFTLLNTSNFEVLYNQTDGFNVTAELHGSVEVDATFGNTSLTIPTITFEELQITNKNPFVKNPGTWDLSGGVGVDFGGFSLSISDVAFDKGKQPEEVQLKFLGSVDLALGDGIDVSSVGGFKVLGKIEANGNERQNWRYDQFKVDMLRVSANKPNAFSFDGLVIFFDDLGEYGKGFQGLLNLQIEKLKVGLAASALFGTSDVGDKYFFVDMLARTKIPFFSIDLLGIGGGVYNNMEQETSVEDLSSAIDEDDLPIPPELADSVETVDETSISDDYELAVKNLVGRSLSGVKYVVSPGKFGLNAGVVMATQGNEEIFNANLNLNIQFQKKSQDNSGGGIEHIKLSGFANTMAPVSWTGPACEGISLATKMEFLFKENRFYADAHSFVNVWGGIIRGNSTIADDSNLLDAYYNGTTCANLHYAGSVMINFEEKDWYIWVGAPSSNLFTAETPMIAGNESFPGPISLMLDAWIGEIGIHSYFDVGTKLPPFPGLPPRVANLTGLKNLLENESSRATGGGFMFGTSIFIKSEARAFGIFDSKFSADVGFDLMLRQFDNIVCVNNNNRDLGINGWYAAGQAWAFVDGSISVENYTIFDLGLGAALQLKGPNPIYARGVIGGRFKVLGGLIKGNCRFPLEFGKECELEGGGQLEYEYDLIANISPFDKSEDIPLETVPAVTFTYEMNKVFELSDENGDPQKWVTKLDFTKLTANGQAIPHQLAWQEGNQFLEVIPSDFLTGNTEYTITVKASIYKSDEDGNTIGQPVDSEEEIQTFTTGESLDYIPPSNIQIAYPADGQFNYYPGESSSNFIALQRGQDKLFENGSTLIQIGNQEESYEVNATYDAIDNQIDYQLPDLTSGGAYRLDVVAGEVSSLDTLYTMFFRVSKYQTFAAKMQQTTIQALVQEAPSQYRYKSNFQGLNEPFGKEELIGLEHYPIALKNVANLEQTPWMENYTNRQLIDGSYLNLYNNCEAMEEIFVDNDLRTVYGTPLPTNAIFIQQDSVAKCVVTPSNFQELNDLKASSNPVAGVSVPYLEYLVADVVSADMSQLVQKIKYGTNDLIRNLEAKIEIEANAFCGDYCDTPDDGRGGTEQIRLGDDVGISNSFFTTAPFAPTPTDSTDPDLSTRECNTQTYRDCCNGSSAFKSGVESQIISLYSTEDECSKAILEIASDICTNIHDPFSRKESFFVPPNTDTNYPVIFNYQLPNGNITSSHSADLNIGVQ